MILKADFNTHIRKHVLKNLMHVHDEISMGNIRTISELIALSKFILKLGKQCSDETFDFWLEDSNECTKNPPDKSEENIQEFRRR